MKELAEETADATIDISDRIKTVQERVAPVSEAIRVISERVEHVLECSRSIGAWWRNSEPRCERWRGASLGPSVAADAVSCLVSRVTAALADITQQVADMERCAQSLADGAKESRTTGAQISELASQLEQLMHGFRVAEAGSLPAPARSTAQPRERATCWRHPSRARPATPNAAGCDLQKHGFRAPEARR